MHPISTQKEKLSSNSERPITPKAKNSPSTPQSENEKKNSEQISTIPKKVTKAESKFTKLVQFITAAFYVITCLLLFGFLMNNIVLAFEKSSVLTKAPGKILTKFPQDLPSPTLLIDGTEIHTICWDNSGKDKNMFVFFEPAEAGFSLSASTLVQELSKHFKVCTYDRLGRGYSTISPSISKNWTIILDNVENKQKLEMKYFQPLDIVLSHIASGFVNSNSATKPEAVLIGHGFGANLLASYISSRSDSPSIPVTLKKAFFIDPIPSNYTPSRALSGKTISQKNIDSILKEFTWYKKKGTMIGSFMAITGILRIQTLLPFKAIPQSVLSTTSISKVEFTSLEDEVIETKFESLKQEHQFKKNRRILNMVLNDQKLWDNSFHDLTLLPSLANYTNNNQQITSKSFPAVKLLLTRNYDAKNYKVSKIWEAKVCDSKSQERQFLLPFANPNSDIEIFSSNSKVGDLEQYSDNILKSLFLS